jgi:CheY-like chemotaxis protein
VLVIDDDSTVRELARRYLESEGFAVAVAVDGPEGLQAARALHPAVITLDVLMPPMDGWTVLAALKADPSLASIPVVMLTIVDDRNRGYALGAADFVMKPIDRERLVASLRKHLGLVSSHGDLGTAAAQLEAAPRGATTHEP